MKRDPKTKQAILSKETAQRLEGDIKALRLNDEIIRNISIEQELATVLAGLAVGKKATDEILDKTQEMLIAVTSNLIKSQEIAFISFYENVAQHMEQSLGSPVDLEEAKDFIRSLDLDAEIEELKANYPADEDGPLIWHDLPWNFTLNQILEKYYPLKGITKAVFKYPVKTMLTTDKVTREAFKNTLTGDKPVPLAMERKGHKEITTRARISFDGGLNQALAEKGLEEIDGIVHRAIMTNFDTGNTAMTIPSIYRVITGDEKGRPSKNWEETILNSIDKQMSTVLFLDYSEEIEYYRNLVKKTSKTNELLLKAEIQSMEINGNMVDTVLNVKRPSMLWEYSKQKGQISNLDMKYLNTPGSNTEARVIIKESLLSRILGMKHPGYRMSKNIVLDTVFNQVPGFNDVKTRNAYLNKRRRHTEHILEMLDYWKDTGLIYDYCINTKERLDHSVTIIPEKPEAQPAS